MREKIKFTPKEDLIGILDEMFNEFYEEKKKLIQKQEKRGELSKKDFKRDVKLSIYTSTIIQLRNIIKNSENIVELSKPNYT